MRNELKEAKLTQFVIESALLKKQDHITITSEEIELLTEEVRPSIP